MERRGDDPSRYKTRCVEREKMSVLKQTLEQRLDQALAKMWYVKAEVDYAIKDFSTARFRLEQAEAQLLQKQKALLDAQQEMAVISEELGKLDDEVKENGL